MTQRSLFMCSKSLDSKRLTEHRPLAPSHLFELAFPLPLIKMFPSGESLDWPLSFCFLLPLCQGKVWMERLQMSELPQHPMLEGWHKVSSRRWSSLGCRVCLPGTAMQTKAQDYPGFGEQGLPSVPGSGVHRVEAGLPARFCLEMQQRQCGSPAQRWAVNHQPLLGKPCPRSCLKTALRSLPPTWNGACGRGNGSTVLPPAKQGSGRWAAWAVLPSLAVAWCKAWCWW